MHVGAEIILLIQKSGRNTLKAQRATAFSSRGPPMCSPPTGAMSGDPFEIPLNDLIIGKELGRGQESVVRLATYFDQHVCVTVRRTPSLSLSRQFLVRLLLD